VRADVLFAELASDFGGELVVGGGPFREPPTVMQSTVSEVGTYRAGISDFDLAPTKKYQNSAKDACA